MGMPGVGRGPARTLTGSMLGGELGLLTATAAGPVLEGFLHPGITRTVPYIAPIGILGGIHIQEAGLTETTRALATLLKPYIRERGCRPAKHPGSHRAHDLASWIASYHPSRRLQVRCLP